MLPLPILHNPTGENLLSPHYMKAILTVQSNFGSCFWQGGVSLRSTQWRKNEFTIKEEAKQWPLFCEADCSTKTLTVSDIYISVMTVRGKVPLLRATSP